VLLRRTLLHNALLWHVLIDAAQIKFRPSITHTSVRGFAAATHHGMSSSSSYHGHCRAGLHWPWSITAKVTSSLIGPDAMPRSPIRLEDRFDTTAMCLDVRPLADGVMQH
jgi:hypothetical protein